jgi:hypothetical protein
MRLGFIATCLLFAILICCTKKQGKNPSLAYTDKSLLDSSRNTSYTYYLNKDSLYSGAHGPHGSFKLRFNSIARKALTNNGKLPVGMSFPEGSFIVKDVYNGGSAISAYAFMYKKSGSWLWAEIKPSGDRVHSVNQNPAACTGCHSQTGNRDLVVSFNFY